MELSRSGKYECISLYMYINIWLIWQVKFNFCCFSSARHIQLLSLKSWWNSCSSFESIVILMSNAPVPWRPCGQNNVAWFVIFLNVTFACCLNWHIKSVCVLMSYRYWYSSLELFCVRHLGLSRRSVCRGLNNNCSCRDQQNDINPLSLGQRSKCTSTYVTA